MIMDCTFDVLLELLPLTSFASIPGICKVAFQETLTVKTTWYMSMKKCKFILVWKMWK